MGSNRRKYSVSETSWGSWVSEGSLQTLIANRFVIRREGFFECTPNGLRLFQLMTGQLVEETLEAARKHFEKSPKTEAPAVNIDTICERLCAQRNSRGTLKRILVHSKRGLQPAEIARQNAGRRGFSVSNIWEWVDKVKEQFPGFLPE